MHSRFAIGFTSCFLLLGSGTGARAQTSPVPSKPEARHRGPVVSVDSAPVVDEAFRALRTRLRDHRAASFAPSAAQLVVLERLRHESSGDVRVHWRDLEGTPRWVSGTRLFSPDTSEPTGELRDRATARAFLREVRELLRVDDPDDELVLIDQGVDDLGRGHLRFAQRYRGIEISGRELFVHLDPDGAVDRLNGHVTPTPRNQVLVPDVSEQRANDLAMSLHPGARIEGGTELRLHAVPGSRPRLAWRVELELSIVSRREILIDARSGFALRDLELTQHDEVLGQGVDLFGQSQFMHTWEHGGLYWALDTSKPMFQYAGSPPYVEFSAGGIYILDAENESEPQVYAASTSPTNWPVPEVVSAATSLSDVYDFYFELLGRNSIDGQGGSMKAVVRYESGLDNAAWGGGFMVFGDAQPYAGAFDVVAHEMSHGVIEATANLEYLDQSGALNESFADVLGESAEWYVRGSADWKLGTELNHPIRDFVVPGSLEFKPGVPYPSKMSEYVQPDDPILAPPFTDNGGVHLNSSIPNHAFYLLAEGLPNAIGVQDAVRIYYRALLSLTSSSDFVDARLACVRAAEELHGPGSPEAIAVGMAYDAVEIFGDAPETPPAPLDPIDAEDSALFLRGNAASLVWRRETELGDPSTGQVLLPGKAVAHQRPSLFGNGSIALLVDASQDIVVVDTETGESDALGFPGLVHSLAVSPDGELFAFVFLSGPGQPSPSISIGDFVTGEMQTFELTDVSTDGGPGSTVLYADAMDFSADGRFLYYDALNAFGLNGAEPGFAWSIFARDLSTGATLATVPAELGQVIGFPSLAQTTDDVLVYEKVDESTGQGAVYVRDLETGATTQLVGGLSGFAVAGFTGDDEAVVFTRIDAAGGPPRLDRLALTKELAPSGSPTVWLGDAANGAIYRRGEYTPPNAEPQGSIVAPSTDLEIQAGESVEFHATADDLNGHYPLAFHWSFDGGAPDSSVGDPGAIAFSTPGTYRVRLTVTDSEGLSDSTPHERTIVVTASQGSAGTASGGGGGGGCVARPGGGGDPLLVILAAALGLHALVRRRASRVAAR